MRALAIAICCCLHVHVRQRAATGSQKHRPAAPLQPRYASALQTQKETTPGGAVSDLHSPPWRCGRNDLEPGVQVGTLWSYRASRYEADLHTQLRRAPMVVIKGQGECFARCRW